MYGKRNAKYDFLNENNLKTIPFVELPNKEPNYYMVKKDYELSESYEKGIEVFRLFNLYSSGVKTSNDKVLVDFEKNKLIEKVSGHYNVDINTEKINKYSYKPFIDKYIYFDNNLIGRSRLEFMSNFLDKENYSLCLMRNLVNTENYNTVFVSKNIMDINFYGFQTYSLILYLYPETNGQQSIAEKDERKPNLNAEIINQIAEKLALTFTNEKEETKGTFAPIDILDYIYAMLHSPTYREKYKEFLKIDFPRVPYPKDQDTFWKLVKLGGEIRQIHLLESATVEQYITQYPIAGDNLVSRKMSKNSPGYVPNNETHGKVYINDEQYFDNVPLVAWEFYIGGYQPAQKWLKDRNGRKLEWEDIAHYQKIIVALCETDRIMKEIDEIKI